MRRILPITSRVLLALLVLVSGLFIAPGVADAAPLVRGTWEWQNPLPQGNGLTGAHLEANAWWVVGAERTILTSTDNGANWTLLRPDFLTIDVYAQSATSAWVVGGDGIHKTADGGATWQRQDSPASVASVRAVHFASVATGWTVGGGGTIFKTTDGGVSGWQQQASGVTDALTDVWAFNDTQAVAVGWNGTLLRTSNGGTTWTKITSPVSTDLWGVWFADSLNGWAVGSGGTILYTTTGGASWVQQASPTGESLYAVAGSSLFNTRAVGFGGIVLKLNTSTSPWSWDIEIPSSGNPTLRAAGVMSDTLALVFGEQGYIRQYASGMWTVKSTHRVAQVSDVDFSSDTHGWAVADSGRVLRTTDGGTTWTLKLAVADEYPTLRAVCAVTDTLGIAVGDGGTIYRTADGGATWQRRTSGTSDHLRDVTFLDASRGWAVGYAGTMLSTTDGGLNWASVSTGTLEDLNALKVIGASTWVTVGTNGMVRITSNSGGTWKSAGPETTVTLHDVDFVDADTGWVVGASGRVYHTANGGRSWELRKPNDTMTVRSVTAIDAQTVWIAGDRGLLWRTSDAGLSWAYDYPRASSNLYGAHFIDANNGWIVGDGGAILKRVPGLPPVIEIEGSNRYATAVAASQEAYPGELDPAGARTVIIATGENWPDALGGSSLAGVLDGPILLTRPGSLPGAVSDEIGRLKATKAIILGGTAAVSGDVEAALKTLLGNTAVERIAGNDRYKTADAVAKRVITVKGGAYDGKAFVATGGNFPDALAAAPLAAAKHWPLFLAHPTRGITAGTQAAMAGVTDVLVLGGTAVVPQPVEDYLKATYGSTKVRRLAGANRFATAVVVATYGVDSAGLGWNRVGIATGDNFPDALAGGVLQGKQGSVMLLTRSSALSTPTRDVLVANKAAIDSVTFFGGASAVSDAVRTSVANAVK